METMVEATLLDYKVVKDDSGHFHITINANGKVIESDLGTDEKTAQGKTITLVDGLTQALDTIIDGMINAYGSAEDAQDNAQAMVDEFVEDVTKKN
jgi:uncharacterized protein YegP (UPF0339 family)